MSDFGWIVGEGPFPPHTFHGLFETREEAETFAATIDGETNVDLLVSPRELNEQGAGNGR